MARAHSWLVVQCKIFNMKYLERTHSKFIYQTGMPQLLFIYYYYCASAYMHGYVLRRIIRLHYRPQPEVNIYINV